MGAIGLDRTVRRRERIEMTGLIGPEQTAALIGERIDAWRGEELADAVIVGIGVAVPGLVRSSDGLVRDAPHLAWTDVALRELIESATGLPTAVGNDAAMGAVAEHLFGAARGIDDIVYLNGGASGIGGGLIVQGMPIGGASGYSGEFGQNRPGIASPADRRAGDGVLEDEVSRARLLAALGRSNVDEPTLAAPAAHDPHPRRRGGDRPPAPHPGHSARERRQRAQSGRRRPGRIPRDAGRPRSRGLHARLWWLRPCRPTARTCRSARPPSGRTACSSARRRRHSLSC